MTDFAGTNFSQYQTWKPLTAPSGQVYYEVPGTGYLYDPFLSQAKGRPVLFQNPKPQLDAIEEQKKAQKEAASPLNQILPYAGAVGGTVGANWLVDRLSPDTAAEIAAKAIPGAAKGATAPLATSPAEAFSQNLAPTTPTGVSASYAGDAAQGANIVPSAPPGMPIENGLTPGNVFSAAIAAKGGYDTIQGLQHGGEGLRSGLTEMGGGLGSLFGGPVGAGIGALGGNAIGYGLQGSGWKNDLALVGTLGPIGGALAVARHLGFNPIHETTRQAEQRRWGSLADKGIADAPAAFAANHPEGDTGVWQSGPKAGKKWTMEDALDLAKQDPGQFRLVYGNYKTFGNDWSGYTPEQQNQILRRLVDENLYESKKGDIIITDEEKARKIKDEVLGGAAPNTGGLTTKPAMLTNSVVANAYNPRTKEQIMGQQLANKINKRK